MKLKDHYCEVKVFTPSRDTKAAIKEMNRISNLSTLLERILIFVPFFQIFVGPSHRAAPILPAATSTYQLSIQDWKLFADSVRAIGHIKRRQLEKIAFGVADNTTGDERKFWECVYNAL